MTPEQFAYWLQGFIELNGGKAPTAAQWKSIKEHIAEVFTKVTPPVEKTPQKDRGLADRVNPPPRIKLGKKQIENVLRDLRGPFDYPYTLIC